jgi:hypothetical protein
MIPKVFAVYRRDSQNFQIIQTEMNDSGEIQRLKGWARPEIDETADMTDEQQKMWFIGQEWYVEPTNYKGATSILYNCILHDKAYKWWSGHHKLVWSNCEIYKRRETTGHTLWNACHSIPILEFSTKQVYPREYVPIEARWASTAAEDLECELNAARLAYIAHEVSRHVDPSELRIQTPKEKASTIHKHRAVSPMPSDEGSDIHEWETEFTPTAPKAKHSRMGKHLDYMYDSEDDLNNSWSPCVALTILGTCLVGTWSLIGLHALGY